MAEEKAQATDTTQIGGVYIVNGEKVDAQGRPINSREAKAARALLGAQMGAEEEEPTTEPIKAPK